MNSPQPLIWGLQAQDVNLARTFDEISDAAQHMQQVSVQALDQLAAKIGQVNQAMQASGTQNQQLTQSTTATGTALKQTSDHAATFASRLATIGQGLLIYRGFTTLETAVGAASKAFIQAPAAMEQYLATYTHVLGSMEAAKQRVAQITDFSIFSAQTRKDILSMDELLAANQFQAERYGRSIKQVWQDIADAAASRAGVPGADVTHIAEIVNTAAQGDLGRAFLRLRETGLVGKEDLERQGIIFEQGTNRIKATSDQFLSALFAAWEQKFGGLDAVQAKTFNGILSNMQDFSEKAAEALGKDVFAVIRKDAADLFAVLNDPKNLDGLDKTGHRLGEIATLIDNALRTGAQLAALPGLEDQLLRKQGQSGVADLLGNIQQGINPLGGLDKVGAGIDQLANMAGAKVPEAYGAAAAAAAGFGTTATTASDAVTTALEQNAAAAARLKDALAAAAAKVTDARDSEQLALQPLQDQLDNLNRTAQTRQRAYEDMLRPLQDTRTSLQEAAQASSAAFDAQIQPLQDRLTGLSAAADGVRTKYDALIQPLKDQETALDRIYQKQQQQNQLGTLDQQIRRDRILAQDLYSSEGRAAAQRLVGEMGQRQNLQGTIAHTDQKNALADQVTGLERARDRELANIQASEKSTQAQITGLERARERQAKFYQGEQAALDKQIVQIERARDAQNRVFQDLTQHIQDGVQDVERAFKRVELGAALVQHAGQAQMKALEAQQTLLNTSANNVIAHVFTVVNQVRDSVVTTAKAYDALRNIPTGNRDYTTPSYTQPPPGYQGGGHWITSGTQRIWVADDPTTSKIPGRASGGPVDMGWYTVGERGPELLHAGGPGYVAPSGGGSTHLHVTWSFDDTGTPVIRDVVRAELSNPANARRINATASWRGRG